MRLKLNCTHENIQHCIFIPAYIITSGGILLAIMLLGCLLSTSPFYLFLLFLLSCLILTVLGSLLYILWNIPYKLPYEFDGIKNRIATGEISDLDHFEQELAKFITGFFHYMFFTVTHCVIKIKGRTPHKSSEFDFGDPDTMEKEAMMTSDIQFTGSILIAKHKAYGYLVPIWFGETYYGYMLVFTEKPLIQIFKQVLSDFENNFVDDQLIHVYNRHYHNKNTSPKKDLS